MSCDYIEDLATTLWVDIGEPTSMTVGAIVSQITSDAYLGKLSIILGVCFNVDNEGCPVPALDESQQAILGEMFKISYYGRLVTRQAGAGGAERQLLELGEADTKIRWVNSSELAKTYAQLQKDAQAQLDALVRSYFDLGQGADVPRSVDFYGII